jgi:2-polyprenyl-3-methyl-5-hydroxy-6-metoxy-1,4-benzoquinol methylase
VKGATAATTPRGDIGHHVGMSIFDDEAAEWDTPERLRRTHELANAVREHVPLTLDTRAIDVGAGTGLLGLDLLADIGSVVLADPSPGMVDVAEQKIAANGIADASAVVYDLPGDPPAGAPFDLVTSLLALHHIEDTDAVLRSTLAMLGPGGYVALMDLDAEDGSFHDPAEEGIHHNGFDRKTLEAAASAAGFTKVETRIVFEIEREGRSYPLFLLTGARRDEKEA